MVGGMSGQYVTGSLTSCIETKRQSAKALEELPTRGPGVQQVEKKKGSAVANTADRLRALAMETADGAFIGSEEDLIARLEVSRPTLRQASAQIIQENLITVRRGVGGGYFARLPDSMTVSRMAAIYLQSRGLHLPDILEAIRPLRTEVAALAARSKEPEAQQHLRDFVAREEMQLHESAHPTYRDFLSSEREFARILAELATNAVLNLFLSIVYDLTRFTRRDEDVWVNHPERVVAYRRQRIQMARAILDGDDEIAKVASARCSKLVVEWLQADATPLSV